MLEEKLLTGAGGEIALNYSKSENTLLDIEATQGTLQQHNDFIVLLSDIGAMQSNGHRQWFTVMSDIPVFERD